MKQATSHSLIVAAYFAVSFAGILHHELWLDESHHWLLAHDSSTLAGLWKNTRYEGHPILWNLLLYGVTRWTSDPFWMQLLHILISTAAVWVFVRKAPFNLIMKTLFVFGYFMLFEYNLISRNYSLGILFLFLACAAYGSRRPRFLLFCLSIGLAANAHLIFIVITSALFLTVIVGNRGRCRKNFWGYAVFVSAVLFSAIQILPPEDSRFLHNVVQASIDEQRVRGFISLFKGLAAVPDFRSIHFWNSNLFVALSKPVAAVVGLVAYLVPLVLFRSRKTLLFVYLALFGTLVFFFLARLAATRYDGMTYLIIIIGLWIDSVHASQSSDSDMTWANKYSRLRTILIYAMLCVHFCSGVYAYALDFRLPFSGSKSAGEIIGENTDAEIVSVFCEGTIVSPYLRKKLFFICDGRYHSFCVWQSGCNPHWDDAAILAALADRLKHHPKVVFFGNRALDKDQTARWEKANPQLKMAFKGQTPESIVRNNVFYVYEIAKLP